MNPRHRLLAIVLACVLAVLASTQALAHWAARTAHDAMVQQRDHYLLHSLRTAAENYLAIGLNLEQMEALQTLIERERASFDQVLAIDVFAASGTLLYSTDPNALGSQVPPHWRQGLEQSTPWHTDGPAQRQLGVRFDNDLGQAAGGIVLTISTATPPLTLAQWKAHGQQALALLAAAALAIAALLAAGHALAFALFILALAGLGLAELALHLLRHLPPAFGERTDRALLRVARIAALA